MREHVNQDVGSGIHYCRKHKVYTARSANFLSSSFCILTLFAAPKSDLSNFTFYTFRSFIFRSSKKMYFTLFAASFSQLIQTTLPQQSTLIALLSISSVDSGMNYCADSELVFGVDSELESKLERFWAGFQNGFWAGF